MNKNVRVFGEVLFDHFPDGQRVLGGAPFNVAWHLQAFGLKPDFISRVGNDGEGRDVRQAMLHWGMAVENLQTDPHYATGSVKVNVLDGEPSYDILADQSYDFIAADGLVPTDPPDGVLYHGSLALRQPVSAVTFYKLLQAHTGKIFLDVNLRSPWWETVHIKQLLNRADWAKLNEDELKQLQPVQVSLKHAMQSFRHAHHLDTLIVTRGELGAVAINSHDEFFDVVPEGATQVVDTVGAGDAFAAVAILGLLNGWPLPTLLHRAQAFASALVGRQGATVQDKYFYQAYVEAWQYDKSD